MYSSSLARSTRHWPRPPTLIAGTSPVRTSAYIWAFEIDNSMATSSRSKNRGGGLARVGPSEVTAAILERQRLTVSTRLWTTARARHTGRSSLCRRNALRSRPAAHASAGSAAETGKYSMPAYSIVLLELTAKHRSGTLGHVSNFNDTQSDLLDLWMSFLAEIQAAGGSTATERYYLPQRITRDKQARESRAEFEAGRFGERQTVRETTTGKVTGVVSKGDAPTAPLRS